MNINAIKLFVLTFQHRNFASVAKKLNIAPSSVSRAVANLEEELKTRLFQRNTRTLTPTQSGIQYFEKVQPLLDELDAIHQTLTSGDKAPSGLIRLSASTAYGNMVLPDVLMKFCKQYPQVSFDLQLSDGRTDLIENQIDLAIRHGSLSDSSLIARKLSDVEYYLVASPDYLSKAPAINIPSDLDEHRLISFVYTEFANQWHFHKNTRSTSISIEPYLRISNAAVIKDCTLKNMGIAMLADWTVSQDIKKGNLKKILPEWRVSGTHNQSAIWLVQPSRTFVPTQVKAFIDFLLFEQMKA